MSLLGAGRLLGRTLGLVGRVALKIAVTTRMLVTVVGVPAAVILIFPQLAVALLGG